MAEGDGDKTPSTESLTLEVIRRAKKRRHYVREKDEPFMGWSMGIGGLDRITGGILRSGLSIVSGGPGVGKTTFAIQVACTVAEVIPVVYISFENQPLSLAQKILVGSTSTIRSEKLERGLLGPNSIRALETTRNAMRHLRNLFFLRPDEVIGYGVPSAVNGLKRRINAIIEKVRERDEGDQPPGLDDEHNRPNCLVVVDYLQHWAKRVPSDPRQPLRERIEQLGGELADLSSGSIDTLMNISVLAISSQNRRSGYGRSGASSRGGFLSTLNSLKESGDLEYMADVAMFLVPHSKSYTGGDDVRRLVLEVVKNRHGKVGKVNLQYNPSRARFTERRTAPDQSEGR
jgi:replicative DNA helicase